MMVTTVTLNPALDYHITLPGLAPGEIQWFSHSSFSPGGKGINVSLLLSSLGVETRALGIAAGFTGREIARLLEERGCPADMVFLEEGCSRVNVKLQTPGGEETAFNGPGPDIPPQAVAQLLGKLSTLGPEDVLVLSGSLPQGLPETAFPQLLEAARRGRRQAGGGHGRGPAAGVAALPPLPHQAQPGGAVPALPGGGPPHPLGGQGVRQGAPAHGRQERGGLFGGRRGALLLEESGRCLGCRSPRGQAVSTVGAGGLFGGRVPLWVPAPRHLGGRPEMGRCRRGCTAFQEGIATGSQVKAQFPAVGNPHRL